MTDPKDKLVIEREEVDGRGAFFLQREGIRLAEMTYSRAGERLIIVDHTEVDDQLRGLGVARRLLDTLVTWARDTGTQVAATCPYAKGQFDKDPSIRDVVQG
jgi:predicted GNAT family acetyltransferase